MTAKCNLFFQFILIFKTNLGLTEFLSFLRNKYIETISIVHHVYELFVTLLCPTFLTLIVLPFFRSKFDRGREDGHWRRKDGHLLLLHQVGRLPYGLRHRRPLPRVHWVLSRKLHLAIGMVNNQSKLSLT